MRNNGKSEPNGVLMLDGRPLNADFADSIFDESKSINAARAATEIATETVAATEDEALVADQPDVDGQAPVNRESPLSDSGQRETGEAKGKIEPVVIKERIGNLHIHDVFRDACGPVRGDYDDALLAKVEKEGNKDKPTVADGAIIGIPGVRVVLDGHHRLEALKRLSYDEIEVYLAPPEVTDERTAVEWIHQNQKARRNWTREEFEERAKWIYAFYKQDKRDTLMRGTQLPEAANGSRDKSKKNDAGSKTAEVMGCGRTKVMDAVSDKSKPAGKTTGGTAKPKAGGRGEGTQGSGAKAKPDSVSDTDTTDEMVKALVKCINSVNALMKIDRPVSPANVNAQIEALRACLTKLQKRIEK